MTGYLVNAVAVEPVAIRRGAAPRARKRMTARASVGVPAGRIGIIVLMVCALTAAILGPVLGPREVPVERFGTVTVTESGSLWEIAAAHPAPGLDTASTVELIRTANRLDSSVIHIGQVLRVPAAGAERDAFASR